MNIKNPAQAELGRGTLRSHFATTRVGTNYDFRIWNCITLYFIVLPARKYLRDEIMFLR